MVFKCKDSPTLFSLLSICHENIKIPSSRDHTEHTVWYITNDYALSVMVHPAHGMVFYNNEMQIEGMCELDCAGELAEMLDNYGIEIDHEIWRCIGIDQVDFHFVS